MEIQHIYTKQRKEFGLKRPVQRLEPKILMEIMPDNSLKDNFVMLKRQERGISHTQQICEHTFQTSSVQLGNMEIQSKMQSDDPELTQRLRKKIEREAGFSSMVQNSVLEVSPALLLNNAENLTTAYFQPSETVQKQPDDAKILNSFKDQEIVKRAVREVVFCPESNRPPKKFVVCYEKQIQLDNTQQQQQFQTSNNAYLFDISNSNQPDFTLISQFPITTLKFSQKDAHVIICGLSTGAVCVYDTRKGGFPIAASAIQNSHKSEVAELKIVRSKTGSEFVTIGADGQVLFWDYRDLQKPIEQYEIQFENIENLNYPLFSISTEMKILVGSQSGHIFNINKKSKQIEQILAHHGTVYQIQRHPFHQKYYGSCGDWSIKMFADDCKTALFSLIGDSQYVDFAFSQTRPAVLVAVRRNGFLDVYDLFKDMEKPAALLQIFNTCEAVCCDFDASGKFVIVGGSDGQCVLCQLSEGLIESGSQAQERYEKQWVNLMFEREAKRERTLEMRAKQVGKVAEAPEKEIEIDENDEMVLDVVAEYKKLLGQ